MTKRFESREVRFHALSQLPPVQFETLLFLLDIAPSYLSPSTVPQVTRAIELLRWAEACDKLSHLDAKLEGIRGRKPEDGKISGSFRIVKATDIEGASLPTWKFTLMNRSGTSQVIIRLDCEIISYSAYRSHPEARVLNPIAAWDVELPDYEGVHTFFPGDPILVPTDDAVTVSVRFHCSLGDRWVSPKETAEYRMQVRFITDQDLVAASDDFHI